MSIFTLSITVLITLIAIGFRLAQLDAARQWTHLDGTASSADHPRLATYVALGTSFAAGPGILPKDEHGAPLLCMRSGANYPSLVAQSLGLQLADRTCSGATTSSILSNPQFLQPKPQIEAVNQNTRLVTVTIGGNDVFYMRNLIAGSCWFYPRNVPWLLWLSGWCRRVSAERVEAAFSTLPAGFDAIFEGIKRRSPNATVVVVDYLPVLPESGISICSGLALSSEDANQGRQVAARLAQITSDAAHRASALLVSASELGKGHDVCAHPPNQSWIFPFVFPKWLIWGDGGGFAYHPNEEGMKAVAREVVRTVKDAWKL